MSGALPSKRPRPRPRAFHKPAPSAASDALRSSPAPQPLERLAAAARSPSPVKCKADPEFGVKRESSPGFESIRAPSASARASSSTSDRSSTAILRESRNGSTHQARKIPAIDDDDDDFFRRAKRRNGSQDASRIGLNPLGVVEEPSLLGKVLQESDESSEAESDSSLARMSPNGTKRAKLKSGGAAKASALPAWTKAPAKSSKTDSSTPRLDAISIDDSDSEGEGASNGKSKEDEEERRRRKALKRLSLTPPPNIKAYSHSEWNSYIQAAVHGLEGKRQIGDDDELEASKMRDQDDDDFEIEAVTLNPKLARLLGTSVGVKSSTRRRSAAQEIQTTKGTETTSQAPEGSGQGSSADAGPSRASAQSQDEPIVVTDGSQSRTTTRAARVRRSAAEADNDSDDSITFLPRAPRSSASDRKGASTAHDAPSRRRQGPTDADEVIAISSPPRAASGDEHGLAAGGADVSLDLRPQEPVVEKIVIKIHGKAGLKVLRLRLPKTTKVAKMASAVAERALKKGVISAGTTVKLVFDGEVLDPEETLESLDLEDDDQVEAVW